jgi:hypothetical protein
MLEARNRMALIPQLIGFWCDNSEGRNPNNGDSHCQIHSPQGSAMGQDIIMLQALGSKKPVEE